MFSEHTQDSKAAKSYKLLGFKAFQVALIVLAGISLYMVAYPGSWLAQKVSTTIVFAQILAFPTILAAGIVLGNVVLLILFKAKNGSSLAMASCALWIVVALALFIFPQGLPTERAVSSDKQPHSVLSVVAFNTGSTLTPDGFQELINSSSPDVIILAETSAVAAKQALKATSYAGTIFETPNAGFTSTYNGSIAPTTVVVNQRLGAAQLTAGPATSFGTVAIEFEQPGLPIIIGVHTAPPLPGLMDAWKADLDRVIEFGESSKKPMIIAGDFNATLRHGALADRSRLIDAQEFCATRPWHAGTWNSQFPAFLQTPIDHVLISADLQASSCNTTRIGRSDHLSLSTKIAIPSVHPRGTDGNKRTTFAHVYHKGSPHSAPSGTRTHT